MADGIHFLDARGPDGVRIYAIGDVHGRLDLLTRMHERIFSEMESASVFGGKEPPEDWRIIHLGDYVDRGPDSKGVIDYLMAATKRDPRMITLAGNHDFGFSDFLDDPDGGGLFARYGGRETALSYGVNARFENEEVLRETWAELRCNVPGKHRVFLHGLQRTAVFGDFFFCHAGIRPGIALDAQNPDDLIWIRDAFLNYPGLHPKIIVHGHTPAVEPEVMANRVNVDTGAFQSGMLSALAIDGAEKRVFSVR